MGAVSFHEVLEGWVGARQLDVNAGVVTGRRDGTRLRLELDIDVPDVDAVVADAAAVAGVRGTVESILLGGRCDVLSRSSFQLLQARPEPRSARMLYRLLLRDASGAPVTLSGFKVVHDDRGWDLWTDTTSLHVRLLRGHLDRAAEDAAGPSEVLGAGIVEISLPTFLGLVAGMRGAVGDRLRFGQAFLGRLWDIYGGRHKIIHQRPRKKLSVLVVQRLFIQRRADALSNPTLNLPVNHHRVNNRATVFHNDIA